MDLLFATAPVFLLIFLMTKAKAMPSHQALPLVAVIMYLVKLIYFGDNPNLIHATVLQGLLSALVPILVIGGAILLFQTMEASGAMETIKDWLNGVSENQVAQLMIIGWAFSFMIEGASGFGTPAALAAPILVGLGLPAFRVAMFCLVMNSVPVSFGAVGTPTWYGFSPILESMDEPSRSEFLRELGQKTVFLHGIAATVIPLIALLLVLDWKKVRANLGFIYLSVGSCVIPYGILGCFNYEFPALFAGMIGFALSIFYATKGLGLEKAQKTQQVKARKFDFAFWKALFPLWATVLVLIVTRVSQLGVKPLLINQQSLVEFSLGSLGQLSVSKSLVIELSSIFGSSTNWSFQLLYVPWLIPFGLVSFLTFLLFGMKRREVKTVFVSLSSLLAKPSIAMLGALVYVRLIMVGEERAISSMIGFALANSFGENWMLIAPFLGAIGSFFSGSATISNLTFGSIQYSIAQSVGLSTTTALALQSVGSALGNMVCINNIVAICSILKISHQEGRILRRNLLPMFVYGILVVLVAFIFL